MSTLRRGQTRPGTVAEVGLIDLLINFYAIAFVIVVVVSAC
jgi:hypothetical protein